MLGGPQNEAKKIILKRKREKNGGDGEREKERERKKGEWWRGVAFLDL